MNWFEHLTGFRETSYEETRSKLAVNGDTLQSLVNGKRYGIGSLELASLSDLRERVKLAPVQKRRTCRSEAAGRSLSGQSSHSTAYASANWASRVDSIRATRRA